MIMVDRKKLKNPNGLILGTPGSGKSFVAKRKITNAYFVTNDDIIIGDPEGEYYPLVHALGGQVIHISPTSKPDQKPVQEDTFTKVRETVKQDPSSVLTLEQAAALAGVSKPTVSKWCGKSYFPNIKQGKVVRIPAETYKEWLRIYRDWEG